jgi:hypothetical protein
MHLDRRDRGESFGPGRLGLRDLTRTGDREEREPAIPQQHLSGEAVRVSIPRAAGAACVMVKPAVGLGEVADSTFELGPGDTSAGHADSPSQAVEGA